MHVKLALNKIFMVLDGDTPENDADKLRSLLHGMRKGVHRSGLDDEAIDAVNEYLDTWLVDDAIEEDIDSFIEETNDIYDRVVDEEEEDDDDDDDDDSDDED